MIIKKKNIETIFFGNISRTNSLRQTFARQSTLYISKAMHLKKIRQKMVIDSLKKVISILRFSFSFFTNCMLLVFLK